ncbi:MAG: dihydroorotase [Bacteroidetes bacterium]|nr:dihydroorotase [Bacteroidota bacterium]
MKVLIRNAHIICPASLFHGQKKDILLTDGIIRKIADSIDESADETIALEQLHLSIGWMDLFAHFCEPGFEQRETIETGAAAAAAGGFTDVMILPNTNPVVSTKSQVEFIKQRSAALPVNIYPIGSVTKNAEGKELAEMYDMHSSGAIAFSDGTQAVQHPGVLLKALQYMLPFEGTVIQVPADNSIGAHGLMNEGIVSTRLGLPGKPAIAEELMIHRDIELLKYCKSKLHITGISTRKGIELIAKAKSEGLQLTASVTPYHFFFCDEDLESYDTNLKVNPPLRTKEDMMAIREALLTGTIDCIASHHLPQHWDDKTCEFEYAKNGMTGLETVFAASNTYSSNIDALIDKLSIAPRKIFNVPVPEIKEGAEACFTLFNPEHEFVFDQSMIKSASSNNAFIGKKLKGKVYGIINKNKISINR